MYHRYTRVRRRTVSAVEDFCLFAIDGRHASKVEGLEGLEHAHAEEAIVLGLHRTEKEDRVVWSGQSSRKFSCSNKPAPALRRIAHETGHSTSLTSLGLALWHRRIAHGLD